MIRVILVLFVMLVLAGGSIALIKSITQRHQASKPDYDNIARLEKELLDPKMLEFDMSGKPLGDDPYQHYLYVKAQLAKVERELKEAEIACGIVKWHDASLINWNWGSTP